jgi:tRNA-dihydrouridine synthase B
MKTYFQMLVEEDVPAAMGKMKQFASWFTHGVPGGANLRKAVYLAKTEQAILDEVDRFFAEKREDTAAEPSTSELEGMPFASCG